MLILYFFSFITGIIATILMAAEVRPEDTPIYQPNVAEQMVIYHRAATGYAIQNTGVGLGAVTLIERTELATTQDIPDWYKIEPVVGAIRWQSLIGPYDASLRQVVTYIAPNEIEAGLDTRQLAGQMRQVMGDDAQVGIASAGEIRTEIVTGVTYGAASPVFQTRFSNVPIIGGVPDGSLVIVTAVR